MIRRLIIFSLAALCAVIASAADYNTLVKRFRQADRSLTPAEISEIYYGAVSRPDFSPNPDYSKINRLRAEGNYSDLLTACQQALDVTPTALTPLFRLYAAAVNLNHPELAEATQWQINALCDLIFNSGKGVSEPTAWHVARADDITPFLTNYITATIDGISGLGPFTVVKVHLPGNTDSDFLYFIVDKP